MFPNGNINMERDREATEKRLLDTIGQMIAENGFEKIGINAVSAQSGVSKILIYRYFNSIDGLIAAYIRKHDFWLNSSLEFSDAAQVLPAVKKMFREHIEQLRTDPVLRKLYRWELSCDNEVITALKGTAGDNWHEFDKTSLRCHRMSSTGNSSVICDDYGIHNLSGNAWRLLPRI